MAPERRPEVEKEVCSIVHLVKLGAGEYCPNSSQSSIYAGMIFPLSTIVSFNTHDVKNPREVM
jgi:hypothetical protein